MGRSIGVAVLATSAIAGSVGAGRGLADSTGTLRGTWGFSASGTIVPPAALVPVPAVAAGVMTFDGSGGCSIADTINISGTSASRTSATCSYAVGLDGQGTITATFLEDPGPTPLAFVLVDNGRELRFIRTDLGVASGVAKRQ